MGAAKQTFVLEWLGSLHERARSPPAQTSEENVMKTLIRVVKRGSAVKEDKSKAAPAKPLLTTETIVKSWIIESREQRRAAMSQLQSSIVWKEFGGLTRG